MEMKPQTAKQQDFKLRWIEMEKEEIFRLMEQNNNSDNNFHFKSYPNDY